MGSPRRGSRIFREATRGALELGQSSALALGRCRDGERLAPFPESLRFVDRRASRLGVRPVELSGGRLGHGFSAGCSDTETSLAGPIRVLDLSSAMMRRMEARISSMLGSAALCAEAVIDACSPFGQETHSATHRILRTHAGPENESPGAFRKFSEFAKPRTRLAHEFRCFPPWRLFAARRLGSPPQIAHLLIMHARLVFFRARGDELERQAPDAFES